MPLGAVMGALIAGSVSSATPMKAPTKNFVRIRVMLCSFACRGLVSDERRRISRTSDQNNASRPELIQIVATPNEGIGVFTGR